MNVKGRKRCDIYTLFETNVDITKSIANNGCQIVLLFQLH